MVVLRMFGIDAPRFLYRLGINGMVWGFGLKVDGNEKWGGAGKVIVIQVLYGIVAIEGYFKFERVLSLLNSLFPFPVA
jgi:hypothetical protein